MTATPAPFPAPGDRAVVPTVEGPRNVLAYATVLGPDVDNPGYISVRTDKPVHGEYVHSIEPADISPVY